MLDFYSLNQQIFIETHSKPDTLLDTEDMAVKKPDKITKSYRVYILSEERDNK